MMVMDTYGYNIDEDDNISFVSDSWVEFALNNDAPELSANKIIGRSLWDFISDSNTRQIYRHFLEKVREEKESQVVEFRCDAPECSRLMRLQMRPLDSNGVELISTCVEEILSEPIALLQRKEPNDASREQESSAVASDDPTQEFLEMCSWCKKVLINDTWSELELAAQQLHLLWSNNPPDISHGICDTCKIALMR